MILYSHFNFPSKLKFFIGTRYPINDKFVCFLLQDVLEAKMPRYIEVNKFMANELENKQMGLDFYALSL